MNTDTIVTIDGPTGAGKSTVGKLLAERIGYTYLDTGAMYRVVALETKRSGIDPEDETALADLCSQIDISFKHESGLRVYSSGRDVTEEIRTPEISMLASRISAKPCVREALVRMQRAYASKGKIIADGRDAGTVIFPTARFKFFLDAIPEVRSQRRYKELIEKNLKVDYSVIHRELLQRDQDDSSRAIAPLKPAPDAVIINTNRMTIEDVVQEMAQAIDAQHLQCHKLTKRGMVLMDKTKKTKQATQELNEGTAGESQMQEEAMLPEESFEKIFEESIKSMQDGEVVQGKVLQITSDYVVIDVGYKSEGQIPIQEFYDSDNQLAVQVGDTIDVLIEDWENENGMMVLSKQKADQMRVWDTISSIHDQDGVIEGKIVSRIKGGLSVDIGLKAFLPGSQVDLHPVRNLDKFIGEIHEFKILKYNRKRGNVVLSRRAIMEKQRESLRKETIKNIREGAIVEGVIKNITDYGVFIDLGGIDGLLHITDISWGRVNSPSEMFSIGDKVSVKILHYDEANQRVSLGYKQIKEDPWGVVEQKYAVGTRVSGKVVNLTNYGAFVELEEGIEGLIHVSEMSWTKKVKHPSQILTVGDRVETVVLDLDIPRKRISLGLKQTEPNPWSVIEEKYPQGTVIEGKIKNITDFGIFIGIDEGIDGLVHISDISWTQKIKHPGEMYKKGQLVKAVVLSIDKENERFSLGIKQLEPDPWENVLKKYRRGQVVKGTVTNVTDFGVFLEIEKGVEGLIHVSEISKDKVDNLKEFAKLGDQLEVLIISIDRRSRKIGLSIRDLKEVEEQRELQEYIAREEQASTATLGDVFKGDLTQNSAEAEQTEATEQKASAAPTDDAAEVETDAALEDNDPPGACDESPVEEESDPSAAQDK